MIYPISAPFFEQPCQQIMVDVQGAPHVELPMFIGCASLFLD